jgi:hypothetical protein
MRARTACANLTLVALLAVGGCAIDVDLTSTPSAVPLGGTVTFDIAVTNRSTCPVGGVVAILFPFIPRDLLIDRIEDDELREQLSAFVDAFCTGADVELPDGAGGCRLEDGELFCEIDPTLTLPGAAAQTAVASTASGDEVTCGTDGQKITCRFPRRIVDMAMAQQVSDESFGDLQCATLDGIAACGALLLDPNETKSNQVQLETTRVGVLRNWIIAFPTVQGGVCTGGLLPRRPCEDDVDDCPGALSVCGSGICEGGTEEGFGCNSDADCDGDGECIDCDIPDEDEQVLSGVACTTTASQVEAAPTASGLGLLAMVVSLFTIGRIALRNLRRG